MKVGDVICVADFHDLRPRQVRDFVGNLSRTLLQSRRNRIWAYIKSVTVSMHANDQWLNSTGRLVIEQATDTLQLSS